MIFYVKITSVSRPVGSVDHFVVSAAVLLYNVCGGQTDIGPQHVLHYVYALYMRRAVKKLLVSAWRSML